MGTSTDPDAPLREIAESQQRSKSKPTKKAKKRTTKKAKIAPSKDVISTLSEKELNEVYDEVLLERELGKRSLRDFAKMCWPHMDGTKGKPYIETAWHSDAIADHIQAVLEGQIKRLIISVPPGSGKSSYAAVFGPIWAWIQRPHFKMAFGSYSYANSVRDSIYCSKLIDTKWFRQHWGELVLVKHDKLHVETSEGGIRKVVSVGGQTLGIRADLIVADDPLNIDDVNSEPQRAKVHFWWEHGMRTRGDIDLKEIIIMQRLHRDDLAGYMLREFGGYQELTLPAEYIPNRKCVTFTDDGTKFWEDPRKEEGELLFKEKFPKELLDTLKGTDDESRAMYSAMQQQDPIPPEGNIIKKAWVRYYGISPEEQFALCNKSLISCDLAIKAKVSSTYTVFQVWGIKKPNIFLIDQIRRRMSFIEKLQVLAMLIDKWNSMKGPVVGPKLIEDKAGGSDTKEVLQDKIPGIILIDGNDDKEERMESITWLWQGGNVYVPGKPSREDRGKVDFSHVPWMADFVDEITAFPKAAFTDQAITMSQALVYFSQQMKKGIGIPTPVMGHGRIYEMQQSESARRHTSRLRELFR